MFEPPTCLEAPDTEICALNSSVLPSHEPQPYRHVFKCLSPPTSVLAINYRDICLKVRAPYLYMSGADGDHWVWEIVGHPAELVYLVAEEGLCEGVGPQPQRPVPHGGAHLVHLAYSPRPDLVVDVTVRCVKLPAEELTLILPQNCRRLNFSFATNLQVLRNHQICWKYCPTVQQLGFRMRLRGTRRLNRIQAYCIVRLWSRSAWC